MTIDTILEMLKVELGVSTDAYDETFTMIIEYAVDEIQREGIELDLSAVSDETLVSMYAAWLWRKRETGEGMPRMVRYALNNRLFSQKMQEEG